MGKPEINSHSAVGAALGFYYQSFYSLLLLLKQNSDDAAVGIELLDDVQLTVGGSSLLVQLKHSILLNPAKITIKSVAFWKTIKVWLDVIPSLKLSETHFHMVTVAGLADESELEVLLHPGSNRILLLKALTDEANFVVTARKAAAANGKPLPYEDRRVACEAFLETDQSIKELLLWKILLKPTAPSINNIDEELAKSLPLVPSTYKEEVGVRLLQWWDQQIIYSLCGKRDRLIGLVELQFAISQIISQVSTDTLVAEFEGIDIPKTYLPNGLIARQINLVNGSRTDHKIAHRDEWRARSERSNWVRYRADMATKIGKHDDLLQETWEDRHEQLCDDCKDHIEEIKQSTGKHLLDWVHEKANSHIQQITPGYQSSYYIRGSYHILASELKVGWHPNYRKLLGVDE